MKGSDIHVWKRWIGVKKSHYYPGFTPLSVNTEESACGVIHAVKNLIDEASTKDRCTMCTQAYELKMGLFA